VSFWAPLLTFGWWRPRGLPLFFFLGEIQNGDVRAKVLITYLKSVKWNVTILLLIITEQ
jgi:hypothetical protein